MAKRKTRKSSVRRIYVKAKKSARKYKRTGGIKNMIQPDAMVYGGLRETVSNFLSQYTNKLPLVASIPMNLADEISLALINWYGAKKLKGFAQKVAMKGLIIENARVGQAVADMVKNKNVVKTSTTNSFR
jgi:hypothetical protein